MFVLVSSVSAFVCPSSSNPNSPSPYYRLNDGSSCARGDVQTDEYNDYVCCLQSPKICTDTLVSSPCPIGYDSIEGYCDKKYVCQSDYYENYSASEGECLNGGELIAGTDVCQINVNKTIPYTDSQVNDMFVLYHFDNDLDFGEFVGNRESNDPYNFGYKGLIYNFGNGGGYAGSFGRIVEAGSFSGSLVGGDGKSFKFEPSTSSRYYRVNSQLSLKDLDNFSISLWVEPYSPGVNDVILWQGYSDGNGFGKEVKKSSDSPKSNEMHLGFGIPDGEAQRIQGSFPYENDNSNKTINFFYGDDVASADSIFIMNNSVEISAYQIYHIVVVVENFNGPVATARLYLNGKLIGNDTGTQTNKQYWSYLNSFMLGATEGGHDSKYNGLIDELAIWNRSLSEQEILEVYNEKILSASPRYDEDVILVTSGEENAVAELPEQKNFGNFIRFSQIFGGLYSGNLETLRDCNQDKSNYVLSLLFKTNSLVEFLKSGDYENNICYGDLNCELKTAGECDSNEKCVATISDTTGAKISECGSSQAYDNKICCSSDFIGGISQVDCESKTTKQDCWSGRCSWDYPNSLNNYEGHCCPVGEKWYSKLNQCGDASETICRPAFTGGVFTSSAFDFSSSPPKYCAQVTGGVDTGIWEEVETY